MYVEIVVGFVMFGEQKVVLGCRVRMIKNTIKVQVYFTKKHKRGSIKIYISILIYTLTKRIPVVSDDDISPPSHVNKDLYPKIEVLDGVIKWFPSFYYHFYLIQTMFTNKNNNDKSHICI